MVKIQTSVSISIKKCDEKDFDRFVETIKKEPLFQEKRVIKSKETSEETDEDPKEEVVFIGLSRVFTKLWKAYLRRKENG
jgi:hypothetical protein